jgi:peptidyl-prolyl cis-trans isomerase C
MRLVKSEALYQEAKQSNLDKNKNVIKDINNFRMGLLAQHYLNTLHKKIQIPESITQNLKKIQDNNAISAAHSAYTAKQFKQLKQQIFVELKDKYQVKLFFAESKQSLEQDTILAQGAGFAIKYSDLTRRAKPQEANIDEVIKQLDEKLKTILFAQEAEKLGIEVKNQVADYSRHLLTQTLVGNLEKQWIPNDQILINYFQRHPDLGYIPERRQIGQIVVAEKQRAEHLRERILAGESLFRLAAEFSIDPYGKQHSGDMGWLKENSASPAIEKALKDLADNKVSNIIKTSKGFHLVMIVDRKPAERKSFKDIKDRVKRAYIDEKMSPYLEHLMAKHPVRWQIKDTI